jgi:septation ring formation regulator EzrA
MAPTRQEETNHKLNNDLTSLQAKVNNDIASSHAKMDYIHDELGRQIDEVTSTLKQFMNKF